MFTTVFSKDKATLSLTKVSNLEIQQNFLLAGTSKNRQQLISQLNRYKINYQIHHSEGQVNLAMYLDLGYFAASSGH